MAQSLDIQHINNTAESDGSQPLHSFTHPYEWKNLRKWGTNLIVSLCDCLTFLVSMMLAPSVPQVLQVFRPKGGDEALGAFSVTIYILGFCIGPLLIGPLSDMYGRVFLLRFCMAIFTIFTIACAVSTSLEMLIAFRLLAGMFGAAPMSIGGAIITDMYPPNLRSRPMAWFSVGTMLGPAFGPALGGVINGTKGWRWVFWITAILAGTCNLALLLVQESHFPTLVRHEARKNIESRKDWRAWLPKNMSLPWSTLQHSFSESAKTTFRSPVVALILLLSLVHNGIINMILSSLGSVFQSQYNFGPITVGLAYLGIGFGGLAALGTANKTTEFMVRRLAGAKLVVEGLHNFPLLLISLPVACASLIWYGWACETSVQWSVPVIGLFFFGYTYMSIRLSTQLFLIQVTPTQPASALAAHTIASSIGGALIPLVTWPLYNSLGYGWVSAAAILKPLILSLIGILFLYISFILLLAIPALQDLVIFLHKVPLTWKDANVPEQWGFLRGQVTSFKLKTTDGETLHAWHVLPLDIYRKHREELRNEPTGLSADVEESLAFRILRNDPEAQVVLYFHGAAGTLGSGWRPQSYRALSATSTNVHVLVIDYRGFSTSTGWPSETGLLNDGLTLVKFAMERAGIPPERTVIFAQSIGTAVAISVTHHYALQSPPTLFAGTVLVAPFADVESLTRTYRVAGTIPLLSPVAFFPKLLALLNRFIRTKFPSKEKLADVIRHLDNTKVNSRRRKYDITLIHAEDDYDIPWIHSDLLFWHAVNATLEPSASMSFDDVEKVKEKQKIPLGAGGWQMEWEGKGGVVREEVVKHGLHDRIMSYPVVSLAVSRAFHSQDEE